MALSKDVGWEGEGSSEVAYKAQPLRFTLEGAEELVLAAVHVGPSLRFEARDANLGNAGSTIW